MAPAVAWVAEKGPTTEEALLMGRVRRAAGLVSAAARRMARRSANNNPRWEGRPVCSVWGLWWRPDVAYVAAVPRYLAARGGMLADSIRVAVVAALPVVGLGGLLLTVSLAFILIDFHCVISCFSPFFPIGFLGGLHLCEGFSLASEWRDFSVEWGAPAGQVHAGTWPAGGAPERGRPGGPSGGGVESS